MLATVVLALGSIVTPFGERDADCIVEVPHGTHVSEVAGGLQLDHPAHGRWMHTTSRSPVAACRATIGSTTLAGSFLLAHHPSAASHPSTSCQPRPALLVRARRSFTSILTKPILTVRRPRPKSASQQKARRTLLGRAAELIFIDQLRGDVFGADPAPSTVFWAPPCTESTGNGESSGPEVDTNGRQL